MFSGETHFPYSKEVGEFINMFTCVFYLNQVHMKVVRKILEAEKA